MTARVLKQILEGATSATCVFQGVGHFKKLLTTTRSLLPTRSRKVLDPEKDVDTVN